MPQRRSIIKIIITDILGILCLLLVPLLGPLPGPGGIPLLLAGLGLLATNHEFAAKWLHYAQKHSESLRHIFFPNTPIIQWAWDIGVIFLLVGGTWLNVVTDNWILKGISIGIMALSTTIFMLNRNRITWFDKKIRRNNH
jgi:hypothetical protein